ncbi:DUF4352 domain-containing protein [Candidatus Saccharibacteria bacterium]|nr:DUF4352 domain-containing protein [Candidatus Saccharibacteria bacterium]
MSNNSPLKPSPVKTSDVKRHPRLKTEQWLFVGTLVLFVASLITLGIAQSIVQKRTHVPYAGVAQGKAITVGSSTITIQKVVHKPGTSHFAAPGGYEYLIVTLRVRNNSEKPFNIAPSIDTYTKTSTGKVAYLTPYELAEPFHSGTILPGESTEGELSYLVPKQASYKFYVEASWSGGVVPFMIQSSNKP